MYKNVKKMIGIAISITSVSFFIIASVSYLLGKYIWINNTKSEPIGYYFVYDNHDIKKGDLSVITISDEYLKIIKKIGYKANSNTLLKTVVATNGDSILITESGVLINNKLLSNSISSKIAKGVELKPISVGYRYKLKKDEYWVMGNTYHSFDSRYFGVINRNSIIKKAKFLF